MSLQRMRIQVCFKKPHVILQKLNNTFKYMKDKQTGNTKNTQSTKQLLYSFIQTLEFQCLRVGDTSHFNFSR